tara:strand:+ start:2559 stop:4247 length:1689 start_codon:yes stop_codon:yes gene_type:complete
MIFWNINNIVLLLLSFCYPFVVSINGTQYDKQDFYSKYSMSDWSLASNKQKKSILEDYIKRESAVQEALSLGFNLDPVVVDRFSDIEKQLLVNFYYDEFVARPLVSLENWALTFKHLKKNVETKHLLISHRESDLSQKNPRTKKEAVDLINNIRLTLNADSSLLDSLILVYSDDPGAQRNRGYLGWLEWGQTPMSFQSSVWGMKKETLSAPIETKYGYHLAYLINSRDSQYAFYDSSSYNYETTKRSLGLVREALPGAALSYENNIFSNDVTLYQDSFEELFLLLQKHTSSLSAGERFVFTDFLLGLENRFLLFTFNEKDYGVRFFLNNIIKQNPSRIPSFNTLDDLVSYFKILILRDVVASKSIGEGLEKNVFFIKRLNIEKARFLYDFYLKHIVNSVENPDSLLINEYYLNNRSEKYFIPEKVRIRQIRVKNKNLADSLSFLVSKENFESMAATFSINRKKEGGLMEPFERGKFNNLGESAFLLSIDEISPVIENLDKTFSIIILEEKINSEYLPLSKVYKRIESLLLKEGQENIKKDIFEKFLNNEDLIINDEFKAYFN